MKPLHRLPFYPWGRQVTGVGIRRPTDGFQEMQPVAPAACHSQSQEEGGQMQGPEKTKGKNNLLGEIVCAKSAFTGLPQKSSVFFSCFSFFYYLFMKQDDFRALGMC